MNFYDTNLQYLMSDMLVYSFDFKPIKETIKNVFEEISTVPFELAVVLTAKAPTVESPLVQRFCGEGKLKSYQKKEVCVKIREIIKGALSNELESSLKRFSKIKNSLKIEVKSDFSEFRVAISVDRLQKFSPKMLFAVVNHFNVGPLGYCDEVKATVSVARTKGFTPEVVFEDKLPKLLVVDSKKIVSLNDKQKVLEFFSCPDVKEILFSHFFPRGLENDRMRTEITYDSLREDTVAQKRRKVLLPSGEYENLHDAITPYISHEEFLQIIDINDILGFYPSVRAAKTQDVVTAMIDLDVSGFLRTSFSPSVVWKLVISITEEIVKNLTVFLRLPPPLVIFSGSRGVHITYRLAEDSVNSDFNYVNYSELYLLPSQKSLVKNKNSLLHNKFAFVRNLMQAILLYTAQNIPRERIPKAIRERLGVARIMDLFTLSVFSRNKIGVLLDTSSNNASVHRVFSIHPTSGLVSIPLLDPKTKKIRTELKSYSNLKEASKPETVIKNLKAGKKELYRQFPPEITREQVKYLLRPDTLLPTLSVIVRFSDRWATERSPLSMKFWLEMYQLNNFYDYLVAKMLSLERSDRKIGTSYQEIVELIDKSKVKTKKFAREVIDDYFFRKSSFNSIKARLNAFHDLEYYHLFGGGLFLISSEKINQFLNTPFERTRFFKKYTSILNLSSVLLMEISKDNLKIKSDIELALKKLYIRLKLLLREVKLLQSHNKDDKKFLDELKIIQIAVNYNIFIKFFKNLKTVLLLYS